MRDRSVYTKEACEAIIRHIRIYREILLDEEARIIMLYQAAKQFGEPVTAQGKVFGKEKGRRLQLNPAIFSPYLIQAFKSGEPTTLPGYQD